jgi:D-alanine-D-alanine ligase
MSLKVDPDWWKNLFDEVYLVTDARSVCNDEITRLEIDLFSKIVPLQPEYRILDLCGGQGRHAIELCRRGFQDCTVLDYSPSLIRIGSDKAKDRKFRIRFVHGDARCTDFRSEEYDLVLILGNSLGYICDEDADLNILRESLRVLKNNGWLLLDITDGKAAREKISPISWHEIGNDVIVCRQRELEDDAVCSREIVLSKEKGLIRDKTYRIRLYEKAQLTNLVKKSGFKSIQVHSPDFAKLMKQEDLGCMNHRLFLTARKG